MTKKIVTGTLTSIAMVALFTGSPGIAQTRSQTPLDRLIGGLLKKGPVWSEIDEFDVAGVRLGMSPEETRAALEAKGFRTRESDPTQDSWAAVLSSKVAKRREVETDDSKVPMLTVASGGQGERIEVWYAATPQGAVASSVKFHIPSDRMERSVFAQSVEQRYGTATYGDNKSRIFCSKGENSCKPWGVREFPYLKVESSYHFHEVYLSYGSNFGDALDERMAEALEAAAPKDAVATF